MHVSIGLALLASSVPAWAQDTSEGETLSGEVLETVEIRPTPLFADDWTWRTVEATPTPRRGISALGGLGGTTGQVYVLDATGAFWKSDDEGVSWAKTLRGSALSSDEQEDEAILLEAEALAEDFLGESLEAEFDPEALDEDLLEELGRIQEGTDTLAIQDLLDQQAIETEHDARSIWVHPDLPELLLLSRSDGLWRSDNGGLSFELVDSQLALNDAGATPSGLLLGATAEGMVYSVDEGRSWIEASDKLAGVSCRDLLFTGTYWLLATEQGMFRSQSGESWTAIPNGVADRPVEFMVLDPTTPGSGWIASASEVLRFEGHGNRILRISRQNILGVDILLVTPRPGHVIAAGDGGTWESGDGGYTWRPLARGLKSPEVSGLIGTSEGLLLGSPSGFYRLQEGVDEEPEREAPTQPDLDPLLSRALSRAGMDPRRDGVKTVLSATRRILPELSIDGQLVQRNMLAADYFDLTNSADTDLDWRALVTLRWGSSSGSSDPGESEIRPLGDLFYVLGGRVYSGDSRESLQTATSRLLVDATDYRMEVRQRVSDLYFARQRLLQIVPPREEQDLRAATLHQLDLQELSSWLDVYTDGAFSLAQFGE